MPDQYSKHITARFERAYDKEVRYSVKEYGVVHAKQYFMKVQEHINNLVQSPLAHEPRGKNGEYRISNVIKGIHILYHTNEAKKTVTFLDIGGRNRLHEMRKEADTRKTRPRVNLAKKNNL